VKAPVPHRGQTLSAPREDTSAVIMAIMGLSLLIVVMALTLVVEDPP
jgi:hypothetical protein